MRALVAASLFTIVFAFTSLGRFRREGRYGVTMRRRQRKGKVLLPSNSRARKSFGETNAQYDFQTHAYELAKKIPACFASAALLLLLRPYGPQQFAQLL